MHTLLWLLQILLAVVFAATGTWKLLQRKESLAPFMSWVEDYPQERIRLIGLLEVLAAIGLILPGWTGILTWLTPVAATGLVVLMALAALTHHRRGEERMVALTGALGLLALLVAAFRFGPYAW